MNTNDLYTSVYFILRFDSSKFNQIQPIITLNINLFNSNQV